ncbi:class A beta-lactamase [Paeniroseomonas aquatica]|uniref:Beta-lactamase n=1 Tax=Paeniroseomonas aquatica TaxID=373043 RepID=A0ABT8A9K0_9PROT|nr:class A beta-lactamase [Paeniroseomonas aquatica]MDN3566492.1 class A beta-lactamase [Paeniroseomonas aquatica]
MIGRRGMAAGGMMAGLGLMAAARGARAAADPFAGLPAAFAAIEAASGGRLGVAVLDGASGATAGHRAAERFPLASTFKLLAAAAVLARVDAGQDRLDRRIHFGPAELVTYSPLTEPHAGKDGMTLEALCEAAMILSDNTAGNLLLGSLGGPAGLTAFARSLGDAETRLDRTEPTLNEATPGDPRDTTTPAAMLAGLRALTLGTALAPASRERLLGWLRDNRTGDARLRAGLPAGWRAGEKTGSGEHGTTNDVGLVWPPGEVAGGAPVLVAAYLTGTTAPAETRNATLAAVARAVAAALSR